MKWWGYTSTVVRPPDWDPPLIETLGSWWVLTGLGQGNLPCKRAMPLHNWDPHPWLRHWGFGHVPTMSQLGGSRYPQKNPPIEKNAHWNLFTEICVWIPLDRRSSEKLSKIVINKQNVKNISKPSWAKKKGFGKKTGSFKKNTRKKNKKKTLAKSWGGSYMGEGATITFPAWVPPTLGANPTFYDFHLSLCVGTLEWNYGCFRMWSTVGVNSPPPHRAPTFQKKNPRGKFRPARSLTASQP